MRIKVKNFFVAKVVPEIYVKVTSVKNSQMCFLLLTVFLMTSLTGYTLELANREPEPHQNARPFGSSMAARQRIGSLEVWPSFCKKFRLSCPLLDHLSKAIFLLTLTQRALLSLAYRVVFFYKVSCFQRHLICCFCCNQI